MMPGLTRTARMIFAWVLREGRVKRWRIIVMAAVAVVAITIVLTGKEEPDLGEPKAILSAIRIAQEVFRAETLEYVNASSSPSSWYPGGSKGDVIPFDNNAHPDAPAWKKLNVEVERETAFGFVTFAGAAETMPPSPPTRAPLSWPTPSDEPWYVIYAMGEAAGERYLLVTSSFSGEIPVEKITR